MARGWESKSVESQIDDARHRSNEPRRSREELDAERKRESLELSRRNVARELSTARTETHRRALENALGFIEAELGKLR